ncbi:DEAD/DEAH box helicase family protein [Acinetobacter ursingii]|uniref:DEAD/DEAH box helicase family protein n=1 Tax=Acinetobacter ursingii TaxID=108980 RepID=UPI00148F17C2|nr:DEAD/DEAH box helicase family protein [Acinetobacter ursingii]
MKLTPKPHQVEAINANIKLFETHDRLKNIMACGTGKTLVAIKTTIEFIENKDAHNIVVFVPTILLIQQIAATFMNELGRDKYDYGMVCSRNNLSELDDINPDEAEKILKIPVLKSVSKIAAFFKKNTVKPKIIFCTYASSSYLKNYKFDLGIFDEAHKTAGDLNKAYSFALYNENIEITKRLFLTATERVIIHNRKNSTVRIGMNNSQIYGETSYSLSFKRAIYLGLIVDYKLIITVVNKNDISHLINNSEHDIYTLANLYALEKAAKELNVNKIISFHHTVADANTFAIANQTNGSGVFESFHVNGAQNSDFRHKQLQDFKHSHHAYITNARCLTEGVDAPNVNAVAFLDPRSSTVDVVQAIGRAVRLSEGKSIGYIILPLYLWDFEESINNENIGDNTEFKNIVDIISVLQNEDDDLRTNLIHSRFSKERSITNDIPVDIIGNLPKNITKEYIYDNISLEVLSDYESYFISMLEDLDRYVLKNGHGYIYANEENTKLASWAAAQRANKRYKKLPKYREDLLIEHGFIFSINDYEWEEMFLKYKNEKASGIEDYDISDERLKRWLRSQSDFFRTNRLKPYRLEKLKSVGWSYKSKTDIWSVGYDLLLSELEDKTLSTITKKDESYQWLRTQRRRWEYLDEYKQNLLKNLGWDDYLLNLGRHKK